MSTLYRRRFLLIYTLVAALGLALLSACGDAANGSGSAAATEPPQAVVADAARGQQLFESNGCIGCHTTTDQKLVGPGLKGVMEGKGPYADKLSNGKPITDENVAEWIRIGGVGKIGQMPGFNTLSPQDLADLVAYLKTLK